MTDCDIAGSHICNHCRNKIRRHPLMSLIHGLFRLTHLGLESAHARTDIHSQAERVDITILRGHQSGLLHCLPCSGHGIYGKAVLFSHDRRLYSVIGRIKILYLPGQSGLQSFCGERLDEINPTDTRTKVFPKSIYIVSYRRYHSHSRYYNPSFHSIIFRSTAKPDY